jgi:hypothetical protein
MSILIVRSFVIYFLFNGASSSDYIPSNDMRSQRISNDVEKSERQNTEGNKKKHVRMVGPQDLNRDLSTVCTSNGHVTMMIGNFKCIFHICGPRRGATVISFVFQHLLPQWQQFSRTHKISQNKAYPGLQFRISTYVLRMSPTAFHVSSFTLYNYINT